MNYKNYLFAGLGVLSSCSAKQEKEISTKEKMPNVILFLTDDQGFGDLSIHGNPHLDTKNIDKFAREGVEFSNFYVTPACAPTRAGILTGRYTFRTKTTDVGDTTSYMSPDEITIAEELKSHGYMTGMFGKWHLGENYPLNPGNQGFDEVVFHHFCNITKDFPVGTSYFSPALYHNGKLEQYGGYCMDIYADEAIKMMKESQKHDKPFFVYLPTTLAHVPLQISEEYYMPFVEKGVDLETAKVYGMMQNIDDNFGKILAALDEMNIRENTIVIYTSDNGASAHTLDRYHAGLKGLKGFMYDGGVKVPCFMQYPKEIKSPKIVDIPTAYIDILPTILDLCGVENPTGIQIDGRSLKPLATTENPGWDERNIYIQWRIDMPMDPFRHIMVRNNRYKLVQDDESGHGASRLEYHYMWCKANGYKDYKFSNDIDFELYDMLNDPGEKNNIAENHPEIVDKFVREYLAWHADVFSTRGHNRPVLKLNAQKLNPNYYTSNYWLKPRYWKVVVETPGIYDVTVHWGNMKTEPKAVYFEFAGKIYQAEINSKEGSHTFKGIEMKSGYHKFQSWVNNKDTKLSVTTEINLASKF